MTIAIDISPHAMGARARSELERMAAVEKVIDAMHERLDQPFTLDEMATIAYLSRFYFNRVFREMTGLPPVRFHTALRIAEAKRLLMDTDLSVTEVCLEVGYQSLGTFITHFRELVGVSPRELRRVANSPPPAAAELAEVFTRPQLRPGPPAVGGEVRGADDHETVFIGLFRHRCPQGVPSACATLRGSDTYLLCSGGRAPLYVAAAAFAPDRPPLVAVTHQPVRLMPGRVTRRDLRLRPLRRTDPPILLALPPC
jgi:AraC family transcriptional regulator